MYHASLRRIYREGKLDHPNLDNTIALYVAVYPRLIYTFLVLRFMPKIPVVNVPHLSLMESDRKEMEVKDREPGNIL